MNPITEHEFNQKSFTEKLDFLLNHPHPHLLKYVEVAVLLEMRETGKNYVERNSTILTGETVVTVCFSAIEKTPYTKWQKLFKLPDWINEPPMDEPANKKQPSRRNMK